MFNLNRIKQLNERLAIKNKIIAEKQKELFSMQKQINLLFNHKDIETAIINDREASNLKIAKLENEKSVLKEKINECSRIIISERDKTRKRNCEFYEQEDNYKKQIAENRFSIKLETFLTYIEILTEGIEEEKINQI